MKRRLVLRLLLLCTLLAFAGWRATVAYGEAVQHERLRLRVAALQDQQSELEDEHNQTVERGKKLQSDPETKLDLLKDRMGYSQRDEIPIVVQVEEPEQ
jgi:cell division protein FtsB